MADLDVAVPRWFGVAGGAIMVCGLQAPVVHAPPLPVGYTPPWATQTGPPFFRNYSLLQVAHGEQVALLALGLAAVVLALLGHFKPLYAIGTIAAAFIYKTHAIMQPMLDKAVAQTVSSPAHPVVNLHVVGQNFAAVDMEWGWSVLVAGCLLVIVAALLSSISITNLVPEPAPVPQGAAVARHTSIPLTGTATARAAPAQVDYGPCAKCAQRNSHHATKCVHCGALLPWAKPAPTSPVQRAKWAPTPPRLPASASVDWGLWGVGVLSFFVPIIGYFLYRSYSNNGDEKAGAAGLGALLGLGFHVARVVLQASVH